MSDETEQLSPQDIAIVGMALRVPGARNVPEFWANLIGGVESIRDLTDEEVAAAAAAGDAVHEPNYVRRTADIPAMEMFDAEFFGLSPKEAAVMDPQHRQFLECAWEALEDAGRMPEGQQGPVGVFAACGMGSYFYFNVCSNRELVEQTGMFMLRHTGNDKDFLSTRASFTFDLRGPSVNVQTACSSSLVAVHYACQSLLSGECDMALAGGVTIDQPHRRGYLFQDGEILAPDGHCRAFDARAAGTVFGSGTGVVVLRRAIDAVADGDVIHAIIKASAINNDGASKAGYLAPSVTGQAEAVIEAHGLANIQADTIGYVECHGTGTFLGDPIEVEALTQAFRISTDKSGFCRIGSVKSNIGHLDTAAGVVSLIKASLAIKNGTIPPTLGFESPNPSIDFARSPFVVNDRLSSWPSISGPRRAAVNSLGVGGTNAHVVIEQAPAVVTAAKAADEPQILMLSARNRAAVDEARQRLAAFIESRPDVPFADIAHTLRHGRRQFGQRTALAVRDRDDAIAALSRPELKRGFDHVAVEGQPEAIFLFPGGGAQHHGMVRELYARDTTFRRAIDEGLGYLPPAAAKEVRAAWLDAATPSEELSRPSVQLPAILIVEVAIARSWIARGVTPSAMVGHSMGENAAACIAGVMSFADAVNLVRVRGELFETVPKGGMLSVSAGIADIEKLVPADVDIASVNAPGLCVVSGPDAALERFSKTLGEHGIETTRVAIDIAAHSQMLDGILPKFRNFLAGLRLSAPRIPIISNVTGTVLSAADAASPDYWVKHLRSTVHFEKCLAAVSGGNKVFIEVGPGRALSSLAKAQGTIEANRVVNSLPHADDPTDDQLHLLAAFGRGFALGLPVQVAGAETGRRISLPTYAFQHRRFFIERQKAEEPTGANLQRLDDMRDWGYRPIWKRSAPDLAADGLVQNHDWLIFLDDGDTGIRLAEALRSRGSRVVTVASGDGFVRRNADDYVICPEQGRPGYDALAAGLAADGAMPTRILYLPLLTHLASHRPGSSYFHRIMESGFHGFTALLQGLMEAGAPEELGVVVVTNGSQQVQGEGLAHPEKAAIEGPVRVAPREMPSTEIRLVDVDLATKPVLSAANAGFFATLRGSVEQPVSPPELIEHLLDEVLAEPGSDIVAWRKGQRWSRQHARLPLAEGAQDIGLKTGGIYLLTGGLGDLALTFAAQLHARHEARIVLLARSELPARATWPSMLQILPRQDRRYRAIKAIADIEAAGGDVLLLTGDVTNPEDVRSALSAAKQRFGKVDGVLHTAGVVDDAPIAGKTPDSAEAVLHPKLQGTLVLDEVLQDEDVDLLVLFSSTSSDTAPAGQVDYVAANAYLNAYAESRKGQAGRKVVAVHWGIWNRVGMAARGMEAATGPAIGLDIAVAGPFFDRWVETADGARWLEARVNAKSSWLIDEHRLSDGQALLPATGYIELISQALRESGLEGLAITDLEFARPLFVPDTGATPIRVGFRHGDRGLSVEIVSGDGDDAQRHAAARLLAAEDLPSDLGAQLIEAEARIPVVSEAPANGQALVSAQEAHLRFGPRWKVLRRLALGQGEAIADLRLVDPFEADLSAGYLAHPGLLDIATGYAMALIPDYAGETLWAPASYGRFTQLRPLPQALKSWVRLADNRDFGDGFAAFDVVMTDPDGELVAVVDRLLLRRLETNTGFASQGHASPARAPQSAAMRNLAMQIRQGIEPEQALDALERALATGASQPIVSSIDLMTLIERAGAEHKARRVDKAAQQGEDDGDYLAPTNPAEAKLASYWSELLGVERVGIEDDFFDNGGHSLIAIRLFRNIRRDFGVDLPISTLFEASTVAKLAALLPTIGEAPHAQNDNVANASAGEKNVHLVAMHVAKDATKAPFFICAGMFGNILNLRHLAHQIGKDRSVYGLQAKGIFGDAAPHETIEDMAAGNLAELRKVQPHGPYFLGGFSGGGLVAYEMAHQLNAAGESVAEIVMLDTPLPTQPGLSKADLLSMKIQDIQRDKGAFLSRWLAQKIAWRRDMRRKQRGGEIAGGESYNNDTIEAAFRRALAAYGVKPYDGHVALYRPKQEVIYHLSNGRRLQDGRNFIFDDNGWTPHVGSLSVTEVPGDHDSMVLDPQVRVLAEHIRRLLRDAETGSTAARAWAAE